MIGWFKCHRGLWLKRGLSIAPKRGEKARRLEAWVWLLSRANYEDNLLHDPPLRAGQLIATRGEVASYTNWTDAAVRAWFKALESEGRITRKTEGRTTVITITNWHLYQGSGGGSVLGPSEQPSQDRTSNQASDKPSARGDSGNGEPGPSEQPSQDRANDQARTDKNKEGKKRRRKKTPLPPEGDGAADAPPDLSTKAGRDRHYPKPGPKRTPPSEYPAEFVEFWKASPFKTAKGGAYADWRARIVSGDCTPSEAIAAVRAYAASPKASAGYVERSTRWICESLDDWLDAARTSPAARQAAAENVPLGERQWSDLTADQRFRLMYPISCEHEVYDVPDCAPHWTAADEDTRRRWVQEAKKR